MHKGQASQTFDLGFRWGSVVSMKVISALIPGTQLNRKLDVSHSWSGVGGASGGNQIPVF
jgi:nicotinamide mononucleotide (NMN) deamidase PncC